MSLNQIEELTSALTKAEAGLLSDKEFQVVVLKSLISLKESHVSVRSRLYNVEKFKNVVKEEVSKLRSPPPNSDSEMGNITEKITDLVSPHKLPSKEELQEARKKFNPRAVDLYLKVFNSRTTAESPVMAFGKAVDLLSELNFNHYGDGHYPLSHYLREIVGPKRQDVAFPDFIQAISISVSRPIPLVYKQVFEEMDKDHNGRLDAKEVFSMMKEVNNKEYTWNEIEEFLAAIDHDHDGTMDYGEMLSAYYFNGGE